MTTSTGPAAVRLLRQGLLAVAAVSVLAIAYELASERHWNSVVQLVPWVVLVVLVAAIVLAASARPGRVAASRVLCVLALLASAFGIYQHVAENYQSGALDQAYSESWESRSLADRLWLASTKSVGPAPPIAPGALAQAAVLVLLATVGRRRRGEPG